MTTKEAEPTFFDRHRNKIPYLFIVMMLILGALYVQRLQKQTCEAAIDQQLLLRDLIDLSVGAYPDSGEDQTVRDIYARIELPPKVCKGTGVNVPARFRRPPTTPGTTTTTTTTTAPSTTAAVERTTMTTRPRRPRNTTTTNSPTTSAPPTTSTTAPPTTSTTAPCVVRVRNLCV